MEIDLDGESEELRSSLRRAWTEQLYREYRNILFQYQLRLAQPLIVISTLKTLWGSWASDKRTLTINSRLIDNYSWDIVIEILKHEMAHQYVSEYLGLDDSPHGPKFQQACEKLGCAEWSKKAGGDLPSEIPRWRDKLLSEEEERLLKKTEKLLALAASSNEHEALLAMQRVREMYAKYNLQQLRDKKHSEDVYLIINQKKKRLPAYENYILSILGEHFFVYCIYSSLYDKEDLTSYKVIELLGSRQNVLMAEYVYHFLQKSLKSLWTAHQKAAKSSDKNSGNNYVKSSGEKSSAHKKSFVFGVLKGFADKLSSQTPAFSNTDSQATSPAAGNSSEDSRSLIRQTSQALEQGMVKKRHPRLKTSWSRSNLVDKSSYEAGQEEGRRLTLNRPVTGRAAESGLMIGSAED